MGAHRARATRAAQAAPVLLGLALVLAAAGCWNRREVNEVALVSAAAVDRTPDGQIRLTLQLTRPTALGGGEQAGGLEGAVHRVSATGGTVFAAARQLNHFLPRKPAWQHNNVLVFSEAVARAGLAPVLDVFLRDAETRLDQWILVARGEEAAAALAVQFELEPNAGLGLRRTYLSGHLTTGEVPRVRLYEFMLALTGETTAPLAAAIEPLYPTEMARGQLTAEGRRRIGGAAVFRQDRLAGWLGDQEVRGLLWLRGEVVSSLVRVPCRQPPGDGIGIETLGSRARLLPKWRMGDRPTVRVQIRVFGRVGDLMCREEFTRPTAMAALRERTAAVIRGEAEAVLRRLQGDLGADPIGVGEALHRAYPRQWQQWKRQWETLWPEMRVIPEVTVELTNLGISVGKPPPGQRLGGGGQGGPGQ